MVVIKFICHSLSTGLINSVGALCKPNCTSILLHGIDSVRRHNTFHDFRRDSQPDWDADRPSFHCIFIRWNVKLCPMLTSSLQQPHWWERHSAKVDWNQWDTIRVKGKNYQVLRNQMDKQQGHLGGGADRGFARLIKKRCQKLYLRWLDLKLWRFSKGRLRSNHNYC